MMGTQCLVFLSIDFFGDSWRGLLFETSSDGSGLISYSQGALRLHFDWKIRIDLWIIKGPSVYTFIEYFHWKIRIDPWVFKGPSAYTFFWKIRIDPWVYEGLLLTASTWNWGLDPSCDKLEHFGVWGMGVDITAIEMNAFWLNVSTFPRLLPWVEVLFFETKRDFHLCICIYY